MLVICKKESDPEILEKSAKGFADSPVIVCRTCSHKVTTPDNRLEMNGRFLHAFANPHGHVFEIGCFSRAGGCISASLPSMAFTWFAGYAWQIGICANCTEHLGWIFVSKKFRFFGLIVEKLIFP